MRTLQETFKDIQDSINLIKDDKMRAKAQAEFDAMPKDPEMWEPSTAHYADIKFKSTATSSVEDIEREFAEYEADEVRKHVGDEYSVDVRVKVDPETNQKQYQYWMKKKTDNGVGESEEYWVKSTEALNMAQLIGYTCKYSSNNQSCNVYINSCDVIRDANFSVSKNSSEKNESFNYAESFSSGKQQLKVTERVNKHGIGVGRDKITTVETKLDDGKIVEINGQKLRTNENNITRITEVNTKKVGQNEFETTRKTTESTVISNTKEKGLLETGESISLSKEGQQVHEVMTL